MLKKIMLTSIFICSLFFVYSIIVAPEEAMSSSVIVSKNTQNSTTELPPSNGTEKKHEERELLSTHASQDSLIQSTNSSTLLKTKNSPDITQTKVQKNIVKEEEKSADQTKDSNVSLALLLKSIQLSQGEDGSELWRLNAKAAQMEQQEENFFVESPQLTYILKPNNTELYVSSDKGIINQKEQGLQFKDNVLITYEDNTIKGSLLIYNGTKKTMTFPEGGLFVGKKIKGSAGVVIWHLDTQKIEAINDVNITFSPDAS